MLEKNALDTDSSVEQNWKILQYNVEFVRFFDTKATIIITTYGLIITFICSTAEVTYAMLVENKILFALTVLSASCALIAVFYAFRCLNPRLIKLNSQTVIFFGHIANHKSYKEFDEKLEMVLSETAMYKKQLSEQIFTNSKVAYGKFRNVAYSMRFSLASLGFLLVELVFYLLQIRWL